MERRSLFVIKLVIGWAILNLSVGGTLILFKVIERRKEKKEEDQHDYKDY